MLFIFFSWELVVDWVKFYIIECFNEIELVKKDDDKDGFDNEESKERKIEENEKKEIGKKGNGKEKKIKGKGKDKKKDKKKFLSK